MNVLHIVAGLPVEGGISQSVPRLCESLCADGVDVTLATTGVEGAVSDAAVRAGASGVSLHLYKPSAFKSLYFSWEMLRGLPALVKKADLVHVHSQWTFPVWWGCYLALRHGKPLVMTPRGCLAPERLKISALKKRVAGWAFDRRFLRRAAVLHATCEAEAGAIKAYVAPGGAGFIRGFTAGFIRHCVPGFIRSKAAGFIRHCVPGFIRSKAAGLRFKVDAADAAGTGCDGGQRAETRTKKVPPSIVVIPNGVDLGEFDAVPADRGFVDDRWPECKGKKIALFLSRLDPIKDVEGLIEAWRACGAASAAGLNAASAAGLKLALPAFDAAAPLFDAAAPLFERGCAAGLNVPQALETLATPALNVAQQLGTFAQRTSNAAKLPWLLVIAGSGDAGYERKLKQQVEQAGLSGSVKFIGAVFGEAKVKLMKAAGVFVLPTKNENFGIVVAESLACGVPVITTKGAPWAELLGSSAQGRSCAAGLNAADAAGLNRRFTPGLSRDCVTGLNAVGASGFGGAAHGSNGLERDGYCDHQPSVLKRLPPSFQYGVTCRRAMVDAIRRVKGQQACSYGCVADEASVDFKPSNQQRSCGLNQAVRPAQTSPAGADQASGGSRSGWWVDVGVEPLAEALAEAMALSDEERAAMGRNGRRLVEERYQWRAVVKRLAALYKQALLAF